MLSNGALIGLRIGFARHAAVAAFRPRDEKGAGSRPAFLTCSGTLGPSRRAREMARSMGVSWSASFATAEASEPVKGQADSHSCARGGSRMVVYIVMCNISYRLLTCRYVANPASLAVTYQVGTQARECRYIINPASLAVKY
jgi:hypothetical protein